MPKNVTINKTDGKWTRPYFSVISKFPLSSVVTEDGLVTIWFFSTYFNPHNTDQKAMSGTWWHTQKVYWELSLGSHICLCGCFLLESFSVCLLPFPSLSEDHAWSTAGTRAPPCQPPFSEGRLVFLEFHSFHFLPCLFCEKVKRSSIFLSSWVSWTIQNICKW